MKKHLPHVSGFILTWIIIFAISGFVFPQIAQAQAADSGAGIIGKILGVGSDVLLAPFGWIAILLLQLASLLTYLGGVILNFVIQFTVVDMAKNISEAGAINDAWRVIRDVANMGFIFVLLYAAIQTILGIGSDTKKLIVNIVVVAILINFSLFFTKLVIDASNVLAITFYDAIAPGALSSNANIGLSNRLMEPLKLTSLWDIKGLELLYKGKTMIIIGVMGTIVSLIAAFVFFAVAIMFIIRFVVLIFVLILSPIAFMAFVLPQLKKYGDQWKDALIGQAFFAPIYFMLTWIVIVVSRGLFKNTDGDLATAFGGLSADGSTVTSPPVESVALLVNFIIMIALLIASLIIAKKWADKAGPGATGLTKWAMGAAGGATLGMAGRFGRGTVGRAGALLGDSEELKKRAAKGGVGGIAARLALATGRKTAGASFDVRGTGLGGTLQAGQAQKGGFAEFKKKQMEAAEKRAKSYGPSVEVIDQAEQAVKRARTDEERGTAQLRLDQLKGVSKKEAPERMRAVLAGDSIIKEKERVERDLKDKQKQIAETTLPELKAQREKELATIKTVLEAATNAAEIRTTEIKDRYKEGIKGVTQERKESYAQVMEQSWWAKARGYNTAAAAQIRKGKNKKETFADLAKEIVKEDEVAEGGGTTPITPSAEGTPPTP
ncbi:MAG: hypothetical protein WD897_00700 [Parcubacteria group bacterium]